MAQNQRMIGINRDEHRSIKMFATSAVIELVLIVLFLSCVDLGTLNSFSRLIEEEDYKGMMTYINTVYFFLAVCRDVYVKAFLILVRVGFSTLHQYHLISFFVDMLAIMAICLFATIVAHKSLNNETDLDSLGGHWLTGPFDYESFQSFGILLLNCLSQFFVYVLFIPRYQHQDEASQVQRLSHEQVLELMTE